LEGFKKPFYRKARSSDLDFILHAERACFNSHDAFKSHQIRHFLENPFHSVITDIITLDGNSIGWACYFTRKNSNKIRLYTVCVLPNFSGKGFAKSYLQKRIASFEKYDAVLLEVRQSNERAIRLYEALGFTIQKKLPGYYPDGEDGVRMVKTL
jgi:ribosomal-protein-alanine N-acetyltransferase